MLKRLLIAICIFLGASHFAQATLTIEITEGVDSAETIAIVPFGWIGNEVPTENTDIAAIVSSDLHRSGYFKPFPEREMLAKPTTAGQVRFENWRIMDVPYLVIGTMRRESADTYEIKFRLYDVFRAKQMLGYQFSVPEKNLRLIAHQISDLIYEEVLGIPGAFATRLAYVKKAPKTTENASRYTLMISDSDTQNEQGLFDSRAAVFSPTWSPDNSKIAFARSLSTGQMISVFTLADGSYEHLTQKGEKFSAPAWSRDGKQMAMVKLENGSADVYVMDLETRKRKRITQHWAIDTEPTFAPDGKSIVFTSDRGGSPQLYQYFFKDERVKRLTFEGKQNLRASFSPDGRMITFVHLDNKGRHQIAILTLDKGEFRVLTKESQEESWHESPSFSPNGAMVVYSAIWRNRTVLAMVSIDGAHQRFSTGRVGGSVYEPTWSSFLTN